MHKIACSIILSALLSPPVLAGLSPPSGVSAAAGDGRVTVTFSAPAVDSSFSPPQDDGQDVISYTLSCSNGKWAVEANTTASPALVTGLKNGTPYTCRARAVYANGYSAWSDPAAAVTPVGKKKSSTDPGGVVPGPDPVGPGPVVNGCQSYELNIDNKSTWPGYGQSVTVTDDQGAAVHFTASSSTRLGICILEGVAGAEGPWNGKEYYISTRACNFTTPADSIHPAYCRRAGSGYCDATVWVTTGAPTEFGYDCVLVSGQSYYLNIRPSVAGKGPASTQVGWSPTGP